MSLNDYQVLVFDVYGTLIDWENGVLDALAPSLPADHTFSRQHLLNTYHHYEAEQQRLTPSMPYTELLTTIHPLILQSLRFPEPSASASAAFGASIGMWPAFPDTVAALHTLRRHFKLVVLSNVDREAFGRTNAGPLQGIPFDLILTAQDVGSYKPDLRNFEYMLKRVQEAFGIGKEGVIQTAQSQMHDHQPARKLGIKSCWIVRPGATMGNVAGDPIADWQFGTLGDMAAAVESGRA